MKLDPSGVPDPTRTAVDSSEAVTQSSTEQLPVTEADGLSEASDGRSEVSDHPSEASEKESEAAGNGNTTTLEKLEKRLEKANKKYKRLQNNRPTMRGKNMASDYGGPRTQKLKQEIASLNAQIEEERRKIASENAA